jgi:hypothetical protein
MVAFRPGSHSLTASGLAGGAGRVSSDFIGLVAERALKAGVHGRSSIALRQGTIARVVQPDEFIRS